ncbi:unnamed protein product [Sordaria macrospora k-hell]|uniref:WGS project CABT00000000 data, contig 2.32 n=1 Tax=Sordaria macrospora (strain ATCC MYA-333 / DSM 997 / K(L3346) / K-hell) TaxID=771870 RepID=F7W5Z6_SORMK|nr:uncharacterized protein SMAC_06076 [Sordaria macrospora k-hell]KAH7628164.1 hypothetical protein B0T09DRAFT_268341 [Sordaria sp. MPI-SDFR-AT-0083]CCC12934.1 unnamed protein product [Sordaria macrospora k-hell]
MAEVLTGIAVATESLTLCIKAIVVLKRFYVTVKEAREDLNKILNLVGRTRNRIELMKMTLIELRKSTDPGIAAGFITACDGLNRTLEDLVQEASTIANGQSRFGIARRLRWSMSHSKVEELVRKLAEQEKEVTNSYMMLNSLTSLRTQQELQKLTRSSDERSEITVAFCQESEERFSDVSTLRNSSEEPATRVRTWLGHTITDHHSPEYLQMRDKLSEAVYWGDWEVVFNKFEEGFQTFGELWGNAPRMKERSQYHNLSMWTPLHQAVYHHAPVHVVERLLEYGAFKTLRTRSSEFSFPNLTPLELAHEMEVFHLYDILSPVVKRPLPPDTLQRIEYNFHRLIRSEVGLRVDAEKLYLPVLEALTELDGETVWFPIKFGYPGAGYLFQLLGRELQVKSVNIQGKASEVLYRVMEDDIYETDQIFNYAGDLKQEKDMIVEEDTAEAWPFKLDV